MSDIAAKNEKRKKLGRVFALLRWMVVSPGLNAETLGGLIGVSERGVYRYLEELTRLGFAIRNEEDGYALYNADILTALKLGLKDQVKRKKRGRFRPDPEADDSGSTDQGVPFVPRVVYVELGEGGPARVKYSFPGSDCLSESIDLEAGASLQVHLAADGVKVEAIDPDRGIGSVVVRWR